MQESPDRAIQVQKLLEFRDKKVAEQCSDEFSARRLVVERRLRAAAIKHKNNERNYSIGRLDRVDKEYLETMCMDYSVLKMAGVAFKHSSTEPPQMDDSESADREETPIVDTHEERQFTMDKLISKELNNDRGSHQIKHVHKGKKLIENAMRNTEIVKSLLNGDHSVVEQRNLPSYNALPSRPVQSQMSVQANERQKNSGIDLGRMVIENPSGPNTSSLHQVMGSNPVYCETNESAYHPSALNSTSENALSQTLVNNYNQHIPLNLPQSPYPSPAPHGTSSGTQLYECPGRGYSATQPVSYAFYQQAPVPSFSSIIQADNRPPTELKKSRSGTLPPRQGNKGRRGDTRSKPPKALRKMENVAKKHDL